MLNQLSNSELANMVYEFLQCRNKYVLVSVGTVTLKWIEDHKEVIVFDGAYNPVLRATKINKIETDEYGYNVKVYEFKVTSKNTNISNSLKNLIQGLRYSKFQTQEQFDAEQAEWLS